VQGQQTGSVLFGITNIPLL